MVISQYEVGQEVDVIVCTKRGKEAEWIPATVYFLTEETVDVLFESGTRQRFHTPFEDRLKPRGAKSTIVFKV